VATEELKQPGPETDHSLSFSAEIKNAWSHNSTPPYIFAMCLRRILPFTFQRQRLNLNRYIEKKKDGARMDGIPVVGNPMTILHVRRA